MIKTDSKGDSLWTWEYTGPENDEVEGVVETSDGHYVLSTFIQSDGAIGYDLQLVKLSPNGNTVWKKMYPMEGDQRCRSVIQMPDGGFVIAAKSKSNCLIIRTDAEGTQTWYRTMSGDAFRDVIATADGGFALIGVQESHFLMAKYKGDNSLEWVKKLGERICLGSSIIQLDDGGYILVGFTGGWFSALSDALVIRTDSQGNQLWEIPYGGDKKDATFLAERTPDGNIAMVGWTKSFSANGLYDIYLLKIDLEGNLLWERTFDGGFRDEAWGLDVTDDGGLIIAGNKIPGDTYHNGKIWLIRTNGSGQTTTGITREMTNTLVTPRLFQNFPNPFNPATTIEFFCDTKSHIKLEIYDLLGRKITTLLNEVRSPGQHSVVWDATNENEQKLSSGIYIARLTADGYQQNIKLMLVN